MATPRRPRRRTRGRNSFRDMGVANEIEIGGQHIPINVRRPTVDITRERGANLRVHERPGGNAEIIVRDERGGGRPPHPREPHRIGPEELQGIGRSLQELKQKRAEALNQLLGGPEQHRAFRTGLKSTRGGILSGIGGLLNPRTWWKGGPAGSIAQIYDSARSSRFGKSGAPLRAAPGGSKIYTTGRAERGRAKRSDRIRRQVNPGSLRTALAEFNGTVDHAFAQLAHNPTSAQHQAYERAVAEATSAFNAKQIEVERAFRQGLTKQGITTGKSGTGSVKRLGRL
ncbi:MAG: hypothetical protein QGI60_01365 [archaeon]|nr:hypothetical protein [archaeon]